MKKKMMIFICLIFFMPLIVLAYSKEVILGGATLGTAAALGTAGAMIGNHMVNNDNNEGL